ncbi:MAG: hypothetical protein LBE01_01520 [Deltaproteobacteria bacterium]|jgi:hypothetical protein|nr:hypothetical protein [Deltaproteobacteria bacterium]
MSSQCHRQLCLALAAWLAAVFLVVKAMGPEAEAQSVLVAAVPKVEAPPPEPAPAPAEAPAPPQDELADFSPCPKGAGSSVGKAALSSFRAHFDERGRFVLLVAYHGSLGSILTRESLFGARPVTALDLAGQYQTDFQSLKVAEGPITTVYLGQHQGFTRLAVNYDPAKTPQRAELEALCRPNATGGLLAVRLAF